LLFRESIEGAVYPLKIKVGSPTVSSSLREGNHFADEAICLFSLFCLCGEALATSIAWWSLVVTRQSLFLCHSGLDLESHLPTSAYLYTGRKLFFFRYKNAVPETA